MQSVYENIDEKNSFHVSFGSGGACVAYAYTVSSYSHHLSLSQIVLKDKARTDIIIRAKVLHMEYED